MLYALLKAAGSPEVLAARFDFPKQLLRHIAARLYQTGPGAQ